MSPSHPIRLSTTHDAILTHHDDEVEELEDHVIMALDSSPNGNIGCAYYIARHEVLYCMQDVEKGGTEVIELLKADVEPTVVLTSLRINSSGLLECGQARSSLLVDDSEHQALPYETTTRPNADFKYESAIIRLCNLNVPTTSESIRFLVPGLKVDYEEGQQVDEIGLIDQQGKLLTIFSSIDLENRLSVGCAGAVLNYLQSTKAIKYIQHDPEAELAYSVSRLEMFSLKDIMHLNANTFSSLQIIQSETHPSIDIQGPNASGLKESLSVYGLFHGFARTPQGKARLRQIFLRPSLNRCTIQHRYDFISTLVRPENVRICQSLNNSLRRIKNMQTILTLLRKGVNRGNQTYGTIRSGVWASLLEFCYHGIDIADTWKEMSNLESLAAFDKAMDTLDKSKLQRLGRMIHNTVDLDESLEQHRTIINKGVDDQLDQVKLAYEGMEQVLANVATEITKTMPTTINQKLNVVYFPQLGFHITVPLDEETKQAIWVGDETWQPRFKTEGYQYFKNNQMREMDRSWGDLHANICDAEIEISHNLAQRVLEDENWIIKASNLCAELDSLLALAHGAIKYNLSRPRISEENVIDIKGGRHILQEMTVPSYVPNDTFLAGGDDRSEGAHQPFMIILTGPNYSGKSVYKKQVALIVYLAQIGSFVPAEAATLGITDKILTRINTAESVSKIQSAFLVDLQQIASALKSCTNQSLVIIDEFGKGTDACDGAGLAAGLFRYLLELGVESPKVLASTHFHEIFECGEFKQHLGVDFVHMQIHMQSDHADKQQNALVTYLYKLQKGRSKQSYGVQCAMMNGIPKQIVDRAELLADLTNNDEDLVAACALPPRAEVEELEDAEMTCRLFLTENFDDQSMDIQAMLQNFDSERTTVPYTPE